MTDSPQHANIATIHAARKRMLAVEDYRRMDELMSTITLDAVIGGLGAWKDDPLTPDEALAFASYASSILGYATDNAVRRARQDGMTWDAIAARFGITRQAASKKWRHV